MLKDFYGKCVLSMDTGGGEVYTVLPAADVSIKAVPYIKGKQPVIDLVNGDRALASMELKFHVDVKIEWKEIGRAKGPELATWVKDAFVNSSTATFKFYPNANGAGTAPDGVNVGVEVIPAFTDDLIQVIYEDRVRQRSATLELKGKSPIAAASLPAWMFN